MRDEQNASDNEITVLAGSPSVELTQDSVFQHAPSASQILPSSIFSVTPQGKILSTNTSMIMDCAGQGSSTTSLLRPDLHQIKQEHLHKNLVKNIIQAKQMKQHESELCDLDKYSIRASESNAYFPIPKAKKTPEEIF